MADERSTATRENVLLSKAQAIHGKAIAFPIKLRTDSEADPSIEWFEDANGERVDPYTAMLALNAAYGTPQSANCKYPDCGCVGRCGAEFLASPTATNEDALKLARSLLEPDLILGATPSEVQLAQALIALSSTGSESVEAASQNAATWLHSGAPHDEAASKIRDVVRFALSASEQSNAAPQVSAASPGAGEGREVGPLPAVAAPSETPRTDAVAPHLNLSNNDLRECARKLRTLARKLERELAEREETVDEMARSWRNADAARVRAEEALAQSAMLPVSEVELHAKASRLFYALDEKGMITGAWTGLSFADVPEHVTQAFYSAAAELIEQASTDANPGGDHG